VKLLTAREVRTHSAWRLAKGGTGQYLFSNTISRKALKTRDGVAPLLLLLFSPVLPYHPERFGQTALPDPPAF